jgi:opacity protein-like surface antigen
LKNLLLAIALFSTSASVALSQAMPQARRLADIQVGGDYSIANSDYTYNDIRGLGFYADIDRGNFGLDLSFHQLDDPNPTQVYERTYEFGPRYVRHYGHFAPYAKALYGRGVFDYPQGEANLAYNLFALDGGVDIAVHPRINVRVEYEYQHWFGFPPNGLTPDMVTIGVAYHIPPGKPRH